MTHSRRVAHFFLTKNFEVVAYLLGYTMHNNRVSVEKKPAAILPAFICAVKNVGPQQQLKNVTKIHFFVKVVVTEYLLAGQVDLCNDFETLPSIV